MPYTTYFPTAEERQLQEQHELEVRTELERPPSVVLSIGGNIYSDHLTANNGSPAPVMQTGRYTPNGGTIPEMVLHHVEDTEEPIPILTPLGRSKSARIFLFTILGLLSLLVVGAIVVPIWVYFREKRMLQGRG